MSSFSRTLLTTLALVGLSAMLSGCGRQTPLAPVSMHTVETARLAADAPSIAPSDPTVQHFEGNTGPGSIYFLDVPANWNHDLVVYVHGITLPPDLPIAQPNYAPLRDALLAQGYAVAASSFDVNGYAVKDGALRTFQLNGLFVSKFGLPRRTYILGRSLGGIIAEKLVETHPEQYAGCLSVSGVLGGSQAEMDYIATLRVLFDAFFPGVLPGSLFDVPPMTQLEYQTNVAPKVAYALMTHPDLLQYIVALMGGRLQGNGGGEYVNGIILALGFQCLGASSIFEMTHEHASFDNAQVTYASPFVPQSVLDDLNAHVARYTATPDAAAYFRNYYEPTGDLAVPMFTLHNSRDPQVPSWHEDGYQALVDGRGHGDHLFQSKKDSFGHDKFTTQEIMAAFAALVTWVETGVKPTIFP